MPERGMDLSVRLITRPIPGIWTRITILIIIVIALLAAWTAGYGAVTTVSVALGAGLLAGRVRPALTASAGLLTAGKADSGSDT